ncbi:MAG: hypothetical protein U9P72_11935, partial [Campylobacterota bacterium]|nr:hypothetical protein [Campylobacterota bacterium]
LFEKDKRVAIEKLLVLLENMLIWSWYKSEEGEESWGEAKVGLLGTSKAITKWDKTDINLDFHDSLEKLELLKRQKTLGVNGRYKGSFVNMGFFSSDYSEYFENDLYDDVKILIQSDTNLNKLYLSIMEFFKNRDKTLSDTLISNYTKVFADEESLLKHTQTFWLENLGFDSSEAKAVFNHVSINEQNNWSEVFTDAKNDFDSLKLQTILELEPKLSYIDALFKFLLLSDGQKINKLTKLPSFKKLEDKIEFYDEITQIKESCGTKDRLEKLRSVQSVESLISYHSEIMKERGHEPWLYIDKDDILQVRVKTRENKDDIEEKLKFELDDISWIHDYYIWSVVNIKKGFNNEAISKV